MKTETPSDVKWMKAATALVVVVSLCTMGWFWGVWCVNRPAFAIKKIVVQGDTQHNSVTTLRANLAGQLVGTFYTVNLEKVKAAFENVPWVRNAVVQRVYPNMLRVKLQEQEPVAFWGSGQSVQLLNSYAEIFDVNLAEVDGLHLPTLNGPADQSANMLAMYEQLKPVFAPVNLVISQLNLNQLGNWTLSFENSGELDLGSGSNEQLLKKVQEFTSVFPMVLANYDKKEMDFQYADLRYTGGFSIRLKGVETKMKGKAGKAG